MPRGTQVDETGWLRESEGVLILQRNKGGRWRLDAGRRAWQLLGREVRVIGTRADFDLLDVLSVEEV